MFITDPQNLGFHLNLRACAGAGARCQRPKPGPALPSRPHRAGLDVIAAGHRAYGPRRPGSPDPGSPIIRDTFLPHGGRCLMSAEPPATSGPDSDDPIGTRYPNTARIWNYQLGGES